MKVVLLAGGQGTRLREETEYRPKPMVNIGRWPVLWHIMKIYSHFGFNEFVICLGYKGEMIKEYFLNYRMMANDFTIHLGKHPVAFHNGNNDLNWKVTLVDTGPNAMTGARLKRIQPHIKEDTFMLTYGDGVADIDVRALVKFHRKHGKLATVTGVTPPSRFGELVVRGDRVVEFSEKPQTRAGLISGGFFVLNTKVFDYLTADDDCIFEQKPLEELTKNGQLMVRPHKGFWHCMDTLRDVHYLNSLWDKGDAPWKVWRW
ncbi:MAG TPA: glucose-1-phosphate cytidylyltransferase [Elusimicrobiota bacterium]|nr:glucose-1-phosphate cytidylyltransferase [Elusimicrobiota bacterium]